MDLSSGEFKTNISFIKNYFKEAGSEFTEKDGATLDFHSSKIVKKSDNLPKGKKGLTSKEKRKNIRIILAQKKMDNNQLIELNNLWQTYVQQIFASILRSTSNINTKAINDSLLRLDLIGAEIIVKKSSSCPSLVGFSGIIILDTKNTFKVASLKDCVLKNVLKEKSEFIIKISDSHHVIIFGSHFLFKPADRAIRKFKLPNQIEIDSQFLIDTFHS